MIPLWVLSFSNCSAADMQVSEQDRARIIRHGHSGTAMLPDTRLSDEEIQDLVTYLASLQPAGFQNQ